MDVETINLQQLCNGVMSKGTNTPEERVQHLAKSMFGRIKADLRAKRGPKVYHIKCINK